MSGLLRLGLCFSEAWFLYAVWLLGLVWSQLWPRSSGAGIPKLNRIIVVPTDSQKLTPQPCFSTGFPSSRFLWSPSPSFSFPSEECLELSGLPWGRREGQCGAQADLSNVQTAFSCQARARVRHSPQCRIEESTPKLSRQQQCFNVIFKRYKWIQEGLPW